MRKIAYVTTYDSSDVHQWSGLGNYIWQAINNGGKANEQIGNLKNGALGTNVSLVKKVYYKLIRSQTYHRDREPITIKKYAAQVKERLISSNAEVVFSPGTIPIAYLETDLPIVFWADATFAGMIDYYPAFTNLCKETVINGHRSEQLALTKCKLAIYASEWAAESAIKNYDVDPSKVKVVPFGANIESIRDTHAIGRIIENKSFDMCKLLFIGVDWERKGGDLALLVAKNLNEQGLKTELHVVGCELPFSPPSFVKTYGFISKATKEGRTLLDRLFSEAHFFIMPSKAECYGLVFAEANSFGLPSLATKAGGIPTVVHNGRNGWTFDEDGGAGDFCAFIKKYMSSKEMYTSLSLSSFREYTERLNWTSAGKHVTKLIEEFC